MLFDESNPINRDESNFVFTTEGHILKLDSKHLKPLSAIRRKFRRVENLQCPAYNPFRVGGTNKELSGLATGVRSRPFADYARALVATASLESDEVWWSPEGYCETPSGDLYVRASVYIHACTLTFALVV